MLVFRDFTLPDHGRSTWWLSPPARWGSPPRYLRENCPLASLAIETLKSIQTSAQTMFAIILFNKKQLTYKRHAMITFTKIVQLIMLYFSISVLFYTVLCCMIFVYLYSYPQWFIFVNEWSINDQKNFSRCARNIPRRNDGRAGVSPRPPDAKVFRPGAEFSPLKTGVV